MSNIIVVVLSLVILAIIVVNVILWNYQMNQSDWERTQEAFTILSISARSPWFVTQTEYRVKEGSNVSGSYLDTQFIDGSYERFRESDPPRKLDINGTFSIDVSSYPLAHIQSVEMRLVYSVDDPKEQWFMEAYNWTSREFSSFGFNSISHSPSVGWNYYAINLTDKWRSYVEDDGRIIVKVHDQGAAQSLAMNVDHLAVRAVADGAVFIFQNKGSNTAHLVSIWVCDSNMHRRYETDIFVSSGETMSYARMDIVLPDGEYTAKVITERGNTGVYVGG